MYPNSLTPRWISYLERRLSWLAIPNLAVILVTLQALGFLFVSMDPIWIERLALVPELVRNGEYWRLVTFLALPVSTNPIWVFFALWFLYFIVNAIESEWGEVRTTLYVLISVVLMIGYAFATDYPLFQISGFQSTLFLAAAALFPEMQVQLFFMLPVKLKWLAALTLLLVIVDFISSNWVERGYLLAMYANYFLFFGPAQMSSLKLIYRRWKYRRKL